MCVLPWLLTPRTGLWTLAGLSLHSYGPAKWVQAGRAAQFAPTTKATGCFLLTAAMEQAVADLIAQNQALANQVQQLTTAVTDLQQRQAAALAVAAPPPSCPLKAPEKFDGRREDYPTFLAQAKLFIQARSREFPTDQVKVSFLISLLKGAAARWATPLLLADAPELANFADFVKALDAAFGDAQKVVRAGRSIRQLRQGSRSVRDYTTDFQILAQDLDWNEPALVDQYVTGLADEVLDELTHTDRPRALGELVQLCYRIDSRLEERRLTRAYSRARSREPRPMPLPSLPKPAPTEDGGEPMQLGGARPRLTPAEKQRRRQQNLCLYCGAAGHFAHLCPEKRTTPRQAGNSCSQATPGLVAWEEQGGPASDSTTSFSR